MSSHTCCAVVGDGLPEVFADGAAMETPLVRISSCAIGWDGIRIATVGSPPVVPSGTMASFGKMIVSGPGQKASISMYAFFTMSGCVRFIVSRSASFSTASVSAMWTISGLSLGRPLAA